MKKHLLYILILLSTFGCNKEFNNRCFENEGEITTVIVPLEKYSRVITWGMFDIFLKQDTTHYMEIETAENLIPYIETKFENNFLEIYDNINCEWSRKYVRTKITLHFEDLTYFKNKASCNLKTIDTIHGNRILIYARYDLADMDLCLDASHIFFKGAFTATGKYFLRGKCNTLEIEIHNGTILDASELESNYAEIYQNSIADVKANVSDVLDASILDVGNIILPYEPDSINIVETNRKAGFVILEQDKKQSVFGNR